jgi:CCR4-NOT transcription complex subunit 1
LRTFSEVCKTDTTSVNLSRILDITQNVKNPLQRLTNCDDYDFAIPLAILAAKREYINVKSWISDRITNSGAKITEALVEYINNNIFKNIKAVQQIESASNPETSKYEAIFENFHLNQATLSVIFEILLSAQKLRSDIPDSLQQKIERANQEFMRLLPDNVAIADTKLIENETNKMLSDLYDGKMPFQTFLNKLTEFKDSTKPEQTEIFACVIQNLFAEYPFYNKFSKPEAIKLSGKIFGSLIRDKIVNGMTQMVCLQSILDALKKKDKLKIFG